jgi:hypothetical protein
MVGLKIICFVIKLKLISDMRMLIICIIRKYKIIE